MLLCQTRYEVWQPYPSPALSSRPARGKSVSLRQLLLDVGDDALAGGDAGLDGLLDAAGHRRRPAAVTTLLRRSTSRATALVSRCEAALAATDQALGTRARLAGLRLATALEAAQGDTATARERLGDVGGDGGDAVTRLQHGADVDRARRARRRCGPASPSSWRRSRWPWRPRASCSARWCACDDRWSSTATWRPSSGWCRGWSCARCACAWRRPSWRRRCASQQTCCCVVVRGGGHVSLSPSSRCSIRILVLSPLGQVYQRTHVCKPLSGLCYSLVTIGRAERRIRS